MLIALSLMCAVVSLGMEPDKIGAQPISAPEYDAESSSSDPYSTYAQCSSSSSESSDDDINHRIMGYLNLMQSAKNSLYDAYSEIRKQSRPIPIGAGTAYYYAEEHLETFLRLKEEFGKTMEEYAKQILVTQDHALPEEYNKQVKDYNKLSQAYDALCNKCYLISREILICINSDKRVRFDIIEEICEYDPEPIHNCQVNDRDPLSVLIEKYKDDLKTRADEWIAFFIKKAYEQCHLNSDDNNGL